jgi:hypothetical protein
MVSLTKLKTKVLLASAALLCTTPLAAALKTKPSTTRVKARTAAPALRVSAPSKNSAHHSTKTAAVSARRGHKGKLQTVTASKPKFHGQQAIDQDRTLEIQQALIREHYLYGEATGEWDQATRDALTHFQGDNHWQTKILPDARALIKLGLGPRQQNLLNPESAAIASPYQAGLEKPASGGSN